MVLRAARLGLLPRDIEGLSAYELALVLRGRREREEAHVWALAWHAANIINRSGFASQGTTAAELMGRAEPAGATNDVHAILAAADAIDAQRDAEARAQAAGWAERFDDVDLLALADEVM